MRRHGRPADPSNQTAVLQGRSLAVTDHPCASCVPPVCPRVHTAYLIFVVFLALLPCLAFCRAVCREVGFLLLGPLCCLGVAQAGRSVDDMLGLWAGALGEAARTELDERR